MASKRVTKSLINTALALKTLAADGVDASGAAQAVTLTGAAVGDRVVAIFGHVKANTGAHTFLIPVLGTDFETTISVKDQIQQLASNLAANTYVFLLQPAKTTLKRP